MNINYGRHHCTASFRLSECLLFGKLICTRTTTTHGDNVYRSVKYSGSSRYSAYFVIGGMHIPR